MHDDSAVDPETNKHHKILDYNLHKGGVDTVDKMCSSIQYPGEQEDWLYFFIFWVYQVWTAAHRENPHKYRRHFLKALSISLMKPYLLKRDELKCLPLDSQLFLKKYKN